TIDPEVDLAPRRGSCLLTFGIGAMLLVIALAIVGLSAAAGWTSGQREANTHATATRHAQIDEQLVRVPTDIANSNLVLLDTRLRWLATQTPGIAGVDAYVVTATALYMHSLPTATPEFTPTPEATVESIAAT